MLRNTQKLLRVPNTPPKLTYFYDAQTDRQNFYQSIPSSKVHKQQKDEEYIDCDLDKSHLAKRMKSTEVGNLWAKPPTGLINYH